LWKSNWIAPYETHIFKLTVIRAQKNGMARTAIARPDEDIPVALLDG